MVRGVVDMDPHWFPIFAIFFDTVCKSIALSMPSSVASDDVVLFWRGPLTVESVAEDSDAFLFNDWGCVCEVRWLEML